MYNVMKYSDANRHLLHGDFENDGWTVYYETECEARFVRDVKGVAYTFADKEDAENFASVLNFGWQRQHVFPELLKKLKDVEK